MARGQNKSLVNTGKLATVMETVSGFEVELAASQAY